MSLSIDNEITRLRSLPVFGKHIIRALSRIETAINNMGAQMGVDATEKMSPPPPVQGLNIKTSGGFVHATITDNNAIQKNIQYFLEYSTDPAFGTAYHVDMGASRTHPPFMLPAMNDSAQPQTWYFRAYSQYHGSVAGKKVNYGGTAPTAVSVGGSLQMTLQPSTGAGTASPFGTQAGQGLGTDVFRLPISPKGK